MTTGLLSADGSQIVTIKQRDLEKVVRSLMIFSRSRVPGTLSLKLARIMGHTDRLFGAYLQEQEALAKEYCERTENGEPVFEGEDQNKAYKIPAEKQDEFNQRIEAIKNDTVTMDVKLINEREINEIQIEPTAIVGIEPFIQAAGRVSLD